MRHELVPLRECLHEALLFRNANRPEARDEAYMTWRYLARPCRLPAHVLWATAEGRPIGAATVAPHDFVAGGYDWRLGVVGDISVAAAERGRGVARLLVQHVREATAPLVPACIVMPNSAALRALEGAGWRTIGAVRRAVRVLHAPSEGTGAIALARRLVKRSLAGALRALDALYRPALRRFAVVPVPPTDRGLAEVWKRLRASERMLAARDAAYLQWRYGDHPVHRYELLALRRGPQTAGYAVVRRDGRSLWIDDAVAFDPAAAAALALGLVERAAASPDVAELHARYSSTAPPGIPWGRFGFILRPDRQLILCGSASAGAGAPAFASLYATGGDKDV